MGTAKRIRVLEGWQGNAAIYELDPPLSSYEGEHQFVIASAVENGYAHETYLFPSDGVTDDPLNWGELTGSQRGITSHTIVFEDLGYTITEGD